MAGFGDREREHFPLQSVEDVVELFRDQIENTKEPNLALLSIVLGALENKLTVHRNVSSASENARTLAPIFPVIELTTCEALYTKFVTLVKGSVDLTRFEKGFATRELVKRVSDVIWSSLTRSYYKDRAHLQSLFSFLTGNKLDCFGVAFAVVAACQVLKYNDVHLALSEDHAWVVFGKDGTETAEVTWHGKGNEDKRGQPINLGGTEKSWLYLSGHPVICTRTTEVAAMVSAINPTINANTDSVEMGSVQQELLWMLYGKGILDKYPMALGNLGDLQEISPMPGRPPPLHFFRQSVEASKKYYGNHHIYPYTYMAGYYFRQHQYAEAVKTWADAAAVVKRYNYNREDEEIYKEFLEIANENIPSMVKSARALVPQEGRKLPLVRDPEVYANLLRFYDGICEWEEGSSTPVLHITWANQLSFSLAKFNADTRCAIIVEGADDDDEEDGDDHSHKEEKNKKELRRSSHSEPPSATPSPTKGRRGRKKNQPAPPDANGDGEVKKDEEKKNKDGKTTDGTPVNGESKSEDPKPSIEELVSQAGVEDSPSQGSNPNIQALAQACGDSILNKDYLLGGGEPFTAAIPTTIAPDSREDLDEYLSSKSNGTTFVGLTMDSVLKAESPADMMLCQGDRERGGGEGRASSASSAALDRLPSVPISLHSQKMKGLRKILTGVKLNLSAIKLQLTAQSQVQMKHSNPSKRGSTEPDQGSSRKRLRRE